VYIILLLLLYVRARHLPLGRDLRRLHYYYYYCCYYHYILCVPRHREAFRFSAKVLISPLRNIISTAAPLPVSDWVTDTHGDNNSNDDSNMYPVVLRFYFLEINVRLFFSPVVRSRSSISLPSHNKVSPRFHST